MTDYAAMADIERKALYAELQGLTEAQWATMTVCDPWTVRHLVAHMTALGNQTAPNFFKGMITTGFNFNKFVDKDLRKFNNGSNADVLAGFAKTLTNGKTPPGPKYVPLGEYMCHGEDIRRAIGSAGKHAEAHVVALAGAYQTTGNPLGGKKRSAGLKLRATDVDWTFGDGPEVAGPGMDLILAMSGRAKSLDNCTGEGVATMRGRC
ncbi:MAG: maleylpyruvate isomerase family mycothiol-dependent enzyme [Actinomycetia bacterium]|nr:maleylpyruvate isomerase family mycothiol-dependent enzyme [Actinomycetes bacterium]